jgi:hypothetical protein
MTDEDRIRQWFNGCESPMWRMSDRDWQRLKRVLRAARAAERKKLKKRMGRAKT